MTVTMCEPDCRTRKWSTSGLLQKSEMEPVPFGAPSKVSGTQEVLNLCRGSGAAMVTEPVHVRVCVSVCARVYMHIWAHVCMLM